MVKVADVVAETAETVAAAMTKVVNVDIAIKTTRKRFCKKH